MNTTTISHLRDEFVEIYEQTGSYRKTAKILCARHPEIPNHNHTRGLIRAELLTDSQTDDRREHQKEQDLKRVKRKDERERDRKFNACEVLLKEIKEGFNQLGTELTCPQKYSGRYKSENPVMVLHLSDLHLQELIDISGNRFDFEVAAQRLQLLSEKTKLMGEAYGAQKVVVAITGDLINSDRRHDEVLNNATNRSRAVILAVHLLRQLLVDLRKSFYLDVIGVCGNEGRAKQELAWSDLGATDSYDSLVYWCLQETLKGVKGIRFNELQSNECLFTIHDQTFLAIHGHQIRMTDQKAVQSLIAKHTHKGVTVTHVIAGHIHSTSISDFASRNSSLCGGNSYSDSGLNYISKAAQNLHIVSQGSMDSIKVDLQNTEGVTGYDVMSELVRMSARTTTAQYNQERQIEPILIK